jgi:hypothetical protein
MFDNHVHSAIIAVSHNTTCLEREKEKEREAVETRKLPPAVLPRLDCNSLSVVLDDTCEAASMPLVWELVPLFVSILRVH